MAVVGEAEREAETKVVATVEAVMVVAMVVVERVEAVSEGGVMVEATGVAAMGVAMGGRRWGR